MSKQIIITIIAVFLFASSDSIAANTLTTGTLTAADYALCFTPHAKNARDNFAWRIFLLGEIHYNSEALKFELPKKMQAMLVKIKIQKHQ